MRQNQGDKCINRSYNRCVLLLCRTFCHTFLAANFVVESAPYHSFFSLQHVIVFLLYNKTILCLEIITYLKFKCLFFVMKQPKYQAYICLTLLIVGIILITGCVQNRPSQETVTCNPPYIKIGTTCCLDQNNNSICDKDEVTKQKPADTTTEMIETQKCIEGYIGGSVCSGDWIERKYQYSNCSYVWILRELCQYGCSDGKCNLEPQTCTKCYTDEYICSSVYSLRKYQREDCSYEWVKWKHCGKYPCKMDGKSAVCDYENPDPAFADVGCCTYSELESFEDSGLWTSRSSSYEFPDTISDRAKISIPLLIQGGLSASYGKDENNLTEGICDVENAQINIKVYKEDLELFFDSLKTEQYGSWESERFVPREKGYHKVVISWQKGNADSGDIWESIDFLFYVSE